MNIDSHGHLIVPEILRTERHDEAWRPVVTRQPNGWQMVSNDRFANGPVPREIVDPERILAHMDAVNVDVMVASPPPFLFFWYLDGPTCLKACSIQNDGLAKVVARYPKRFVGMGIVPLQDTELAITEADRLATELKMPAIEVPSHINGKYLGDRRLWPFWETVQDLDLLVFVHPDEPYNLGVELLDRYYLHNLLGNPIDTARCIADVVFSGLLEAYPRLKFLFAHGGGALPYIRGRWDHGWNMRTEPKVDTKRPPSESIQLLHFDTVTHWDRALEFLVDTVGAHRVVMGSDYPFDMGSPDPVRFVRAVAGISDLDKQRIGSENAIRLLKLDRPA
ncbi:MAG: amidohydrolase [Planctomycetaceae bacterium]|nr:MAG: amidohydrolase [Planctomycetaceae bacterium]